MPYTVPYDVGRNALQLMNFVSCFFDVSSRITRINDQFRLLHDPAVIIDTMIRSNHNTISPIQHALSQISILQSRYFSNKGVMEEDLAPLGLQKMNHLECWRLTKIIG